MVVLSFSQRHCHGRSWSSQPSFCHGKSWMVCYNVLWFYKLWIKKWLKRVESGVTGVLVWLFLCCHGLSLCTHCGKWLRCMRWCPGKGLTGTMNWGSMLLGKNWDCGLWCLSNWYVRLVWTLSTWWPEESHCRKFTTLSAKITAITWRHLTSSSSLALFILFSLTFPTSMPSLAFLWLPQSCLSGNHAT